MSSKFIINQLYFKYFVDYFKEVNGVVKESVCRAVEKTTRLIAICNKHIN